MLTIRPYLIGLALFCQFHSFGQADSIIYYLDTSLNICEKESATVTGIGIKEDNRIKMQAFYHKSGLLMLEGWFTDSTLTVKHGPFVFYNKTGDKESEGFFVNNKQAGYWVTWVNGLIEDSILYRGGIVFERISYVYFDSSIISSKRIYRNTFENVFNTTEWFRNGLIKDKLVTRGGSGTDTSYHENGNIKSITTFLNGTLNSSQFYNKDGSAIKNSDLASRRKGHSVFEMPNGPCYPGGAAGFSSFFQRNFKPPQNYASGIMPESVTVTFYLDKAGFAYDIKVDGASNRDLEIEIMTVFRRMAAWNMNGLSGYGPITYTINLSNNR